MKGIYGIKVDNCLVYVGQAININERIRQHWSQILKDNSDENKYQLLHTCGRTHPITFWLLEEVEGNRDEAEWKWIKALQPCLNSQGTGGTGRRLNINEFYDIVLNEEHYIEGATEWHYIPKNQGQTD